MAEKYQRFENWMVAFRSNVILRNGQVSSTERINSERAKLTLQFPLTAGGWKRLEELVRQHHPELGFLKLLAATPFIPEPSDE